MDVSCSRHLGSWGVAALVEVFEHEVAVAVVELFQGFGFAKVGTTHRADELVLGKRLQPGSSADGSDPLRLSLGGSQSGPRGALVEGAALRA